MASKHVLNNDKSGLRSTLDNKYAHFLQLPRIVIKMPNLTNIDIYGSEYHVWHRNFKEMEILCDLILYGPKKLVKNW